MKQLFILLLAITTGGCFAGVTNSTRTCIASQQGLIGCQIRETSPHASATRRLSALKKTKVKQIAVDNPNHTEEAMLAMQPYCPMRFNNPKQTFSDHFKSGLSARVFASHTGENDSEHDIVRQMFLTCWALSVHYGLSDHKTFYGPLYALSPYLQGVKYSDPEEEEETFIQILLGPLQSTNDDSK